MPVAELMKVVSPVSQKRTLISSQNANRSPNSNEPKNDKAAQLINNYKALPMKELNARPSQKIKLIKKSNPIETTKIKPKPT